MTVFVAFDAAIYQWRGIYIAISVSLMFEDSSTKSKVTARKMWYKVTKSHDLELIEEQNSHCCIENATCWKQYSIASTPVTISHPVYNIFTCMSDSWKWTV